MASKQLEEKDNEAAVLEQFNRMKRQEQELAQKIGELEGDRIEHTRVLENIEKLPGDRKCFRLIGGVLVERTVAEVVPAVRDNKGNIEKALVQLRKNHEEMAGHLRDFVKKYNIKTRSQAEAEERQRQRQGQGQLRIQSYRSTMEARARARARVPLPSPRPQATQNRPGRHRK
eukprot:TRINITY_DN65_c0_g1_i1.p1 TRINITY_DN65_c0_g1~~TRINITY_DN65_c0_g1_i1.p1  ORF type:complete len:173 (-),score=42.02 TRINITY_DN65_c0_g1_i1:196-714(-)